VNVVLNKYDVTLIRISQFELKKRPAIPDDIYSWQFFNDDSNIIKLLHCIDQYEAREINSNAFVEELDGK
jgi:hypothetical protein